jgi:hypothetical protein
MNVSNEQLVSEQAVARAMRATRANDAEVAPKRPTLQSDQCPNIARFAAVLRPKTTRGSQQDEWTEQERAHFRSGCLFCAGMFNLFKASAEWATTSEAKALATAPPGATCEDTVTNLVTSEETHIGLTAPGTKPPAKPPKPQ